MDIRYDIFENLLKCFQKVTESVGEFSQAVIKSEFSTASCGFRGGGGGGVGGGGGEGLGEG